VQSIRCFTTWRGARMRLLAADFSLGALRTEALELHQRFSPVSFTHHVSKICQYCGNRSPTSGSSFVRRRAGPRAFSVWGGDNRAALRPTVAERFSDFRNELACHHRLFHEDHIVPIDRG
jgi:hypothetical protein